MKIYLYTKNDQENLMNVKGSSFPDPNLDEWRGVTVFGEFRDDGTLPDDILNLLCKVREMAENDNDKAQLLLTGTGLVETAHSYFECGADRVFVYDDPSLSSPDSETFKKIIGHFIDNYKPAAILFLRSNLTEFLYDAILDHAAAKGHTPKTVTYDERIGKGSGPGIFSHYGELVICEIPYL